MRPGEPSGKEYWPFSAYKYVRNAVQNVPNSLYWPEVDTTEECDDAELSQYSQLIGVLRWSIELGRIDIYTETALLSQHLALPLVGHLEAVYHIFVYLSEHEKSSIIFDPTDP